MLLSLCTSTLTDIAKVVQLDESEFDQHKQLISDCYIMVCILDNNNPSQNIVWQLAYAYAKNKPVYALAQTKKHPQLEQCFTRRFEHWQDLIEALRKEEGVIVEHRKQ